MCGIFGLIARATSDVSAATLRRLVRTLFKESEMRGKDASGVLSVNADEIVIYKDARRAGLLLQTPGFAAVLDHAERAYGENKSYVIAGHTRMMTSGSEKHQENNQPVVKEDLVLLHNGIIVNDHELWRLHPGWERHSQVDTEVFGVLLLAGVRAGKSMAMALRDALSAAAGANTIAAIHGGHSDMFLGTTNGSLYWWDAEGLGLSVFGSEEHILVQALRLLAKRFPTVDYNIRQVRSGELLALSMTGGPHRVLASVPEHLEAFPDREPRRIRQLPVRIPVVGDPRRPIRNVYSEIERHMHYDTPSLALLKRCRKCLLPESFPFIKFDGDGVCQFCLQHRPTTPRGAVALTALADRVRRTDGRPDCLVPLSGGRDSCFGLHYLKKELGLNPIAYTYDWGFVTDLARRNISRMCGELNVEHVLVAANIKKKRENVRKNVCAWLARPDLGMVPLFMAGDKHFFYYASKIKKQMELGPILFSMNWLEKTGFKVGFAGVNDTSTHSKTHGLTYFNQLKLIYYYGSKLLANRHYFNGSIPDTLAGFFSFYLKTKDYEQLFDYLPWIQDEIESTIIQNYGWETSPDTRSTWRIGDGTAPFYNYIYLTIAGFTENDTFRSNQIREGMIDRMDALKAVEEENRPRVESFKSYCDIIGIDAVAALKVINKAKKLYACRE